MQRKPPIRLNHILMFGKHSGKTLKQIIDEDTGYVRWAKKALTWFYLDEEAFQYYVGVLRKNKAARTVADNWTWFGDDSGYEDGIDELWEFDGG